MFLDKLCCKKMHLILISKVVDKPTSKIWFKKLFEKTTLDWRKIYLSPHLGICISTQILQFFMELLLKHMKHIQIQPRLSCNSSVLKCFILQWQICIIISISVDQYREIARYSAELTAKTSNLTTLPTSSTFSPKNVG